VEWNTAALGPDKRKLAGLLFRRLKERFALGSEPYYGQGKWYPGESLPRWALACYWRRDGVPLWRDAALLADETCEYSYGLEQAERFVRALTRRLGVDPGLVVPGYEDVVYYLWREGTLPANVDPMKYDLKDSEERRRLAKLLEKGLGKIVGYALPLKRQDQEKQGA